MNNVVTVLCNTSFMWLITAVFVTRINLFSHLQSHLVLELHFSFIGL